MTNNFVDGSVSVVSSDQVSAVKKRTSTGEGPKFRKKGISEYLSGYDNSGSNSNNQTDELLKSGQNVKVAPRDVALDFYQ